MAESIRFSRLANLFSIRFRKFAKESLAGDCSGVLEGFGGLLIVFYCFVEGILSKYRCKPTFSVLPMQEMKKSYFYRQRLDVSGFFWLLLYYALDYVLAPPWQPVYHYYHREKILDI